MAKANKAQEFLAETEQHDQARKELERDRREAQRKVESSELQKKYKLALQEIETLSHRCDFLAAIQTDRDKKLFENLANGKGGDSTAVLALSDWHCGELVDPAVVNGINEFNIEIATQRIKRTFQKGLQLLDRLHAFADIRELFIWLGGDLMTGFIHDDLVQSNTMSPVEESLFVQDMVCTGLDTILEDKRIKRIRVATNHGNHGRTTPDRLVSTSYKNSYEWGIYHSVARHYRSNSRIAFKIENGIHNWAEIQGQNIRFHHGDNIRYAGGVGGIAIPVEKKIASWNKSKRADLDVFGHYHQFVDHYRWVCNASLIGHTAYAISIGAEPQPPSQTLIVVSREYGKVMAIPIFCE